MNFPQIPQSKAMTLWALFFLLGTCSSDWTIPRPVFNYDLDEGVLRTVSATDLIGINLSSLGIESLAPNSLDTLTNAEVLSLSNNELSHLPSQIFSKLVKLRILSLANNRISLFHEMFLGLTALVRLDLSSNSITSLKSGDLFGLPRYVEVIVKNNPITWFSNKIFEDLSASTDNEERKKRRNYAIGDAVDCKLHMNAHGIVMLLKDCELSEFVGVDLPNDITGSLSNPLIYRIMITHRQIKGFNGNWANFKTFSYNIVSFASNKIEYLSPELLNPLPQTVEWLQISHNDIHIIKNNGLHHDYPISLDLSYNRITEIEHFALENVKLNYLNLSFNHLENTYFAATLPISMTQLNLDGNKISEVPEHSFDRLKNLEVLTMNNNRLKHISGIFGRMKSLSRLELAGNWISHVPLKFFRGFNNLDYLDLSRNKIERLQSDIFKYWKNSRKLTLLLGDNPMNTIEKGVFHRMSLDHVQLSFNSITLRMVAGPDRIYGVPENIFDESNISRISLSLPQPWFHGDWFKGISGLQEVNFNVSGVKILESSITKDFGSVNKLSLDMPDLEVIDNGALSGMKKGKEIVVSLNAPKLEIIRGSFADDYFSLNHH